MANFVTEDDKRIRDLQQETSPLASDFLAIDRPGWTAAKRMTVQQVINMAAASAPFAKSYAGTSNPDDAFGDNGDLYFTIPADGTSLKLFQKILNSWSLVFTLPITTAQDLQSVTELGAVTDRAITITGFEDVDYSIDGIKIQIDPGDETGGLLRTKTGSVINGLFFSPDSTGLLFQESGGIASELSLNTQTGLVAGVRLVSNRIQIAPAINGNEAVTKNQLDGAVSGAFVTIPKTHADLVSNGDGTYYLPVDITTQIIFEIKLTADTKTFRVDLSQVVQDTAWTPQTRIYGFANNDTQTINIQVNAI